MAKSGKVSLKLMVDKEKNRVVFAECNNDFVDILFSFLTLPLGTIIRLLGKISSLGCLGRLYESIAHLDMECLETKACNNMLLLPRSASEEHCEELKINLNDLYPRRSYVCSSEDCTDTLRLYSLATSARCRCGKTMIDSIEMSSCFGEENREGVFVKGRANRFVVTYDLRVMPACTAPGLVLVNEFGIRDGAVLEERDVEVGKEEVLSLLGRSLLSKAPLSEVFLGVIVNAVEEHNGKETMQTKVESNNNEGLNQIDLKLIVNKENGEVLYAEAKDDFINFLFSFLTFPLGSIFRLLGNHFSLGCANNLYTSVETLSDSENEFMKPECLGMLLDPRLATFFGCCDQILDIEERPPTLVTLVGTKVQLSAVNPKLPDSGSKSGGGFVKRPQRFMVTVDLEVKPMSLVAAINLANKLKVPISNLEEKIVCLGEAEALNLLKASLTSKRALSNAFPLGKRRRRRRLRRAFR